MKECNKCDTTPQSLFPSVFSRTAASVTTALRKRHMLHFHPLPLHSVTLRVTLPGPCESLSNTGLAPQCYTVTRKKQIPPSQSFLCPDRSPRVSDSLPPRCPAKSVCKRVPILGAFEPRCAALAGKRSVSHRRRANTRGAGDVGFLSLERASIAFVCTSALGRRTDKCLRGPCPHPLWGAAPNPVATENQNEMEDTHEQRYRFQHPHFQ